ncbi:AAA family ATPase [Streptomyces sp. NPDC048251]|uniref:AAA family ATPase n=1 Tax=Streptomyces sp. NPDC048251 TaxID=3154501 RepID=UPI00342B8687
MTTSFDSRFCIHLVDGRPCDMTEATHDGGQIGHAFVAPDMGDRPVCQRHSQYLPCQHSECSGEQHDRGGADDGGREDGGAGANERSPRLDWFEAFDTDFSKVDWLPGKFMERGQQVAIVGDGKVGKTLFVHDWLYRGVSGRPFLGDRPRERLRVLYFDRENSLRDIVTRMMAFGAKPDDLQERFDYRRFPKFSGGLDSAQIAILELMAIVEASEPDVVVLDTISRFIEGKENDSDTWLALYRRLHAPLKDKGIACVRLDHMGKDSERGSRGSSAKSQDVDHVWELTRVDEATTHDESGDTVATTIRMKRTHTRTGIGDDAINIVRRGHKGLSGLWTPGMTRHEITDASEQRQQDQLIQSYVDELLARDAPPLGRDKLRDWCASRGVNFPGKDTVAAEVTKRFKAQRGQRNA